MVDSFKKSIDNVVELAERLSQSHKNNRELILHMYLNGQARLDGIYSILLDLHYSGHLDSYKEISDYIDEARDQLAKILKYK